MFPCVFQLLTWYLLSLEELYRTKRSLNRNAELPFTPWAGVDLKIAPHRRVARGEGSTSLQVTAFRIEATPFCLSWPSPSPDEPQPSPLALGFMACELGS